METYGTPLSGEEIVEMFPHDYRTSDAVATFLANLRQFNLRLVPAIKPLPAGWYWVKISWNNKLRVCVQKYDGALWSSWDDGMNPSATPLFVARDIRDLRFRPADLEFTRWLADGSARFKGVPS